jgi:hypothetical protein
LREGLTCQRGDRPEQPQRVACGVKREQPVPRLSQGARPQCEMRARTARTVPARVPCGR